MKTKILDFLDFEKVNALLEGFNQTTGFVTAILDLEGNVLSQSGWRRICTEYHRLNAETVQNCLISDTVLAGNMKKGEKYHFYQCLNGLVDVAIPIVIHEVHIANLFSGQFFFNKPDKSFFREQAKKYGFDEKDYLKSLDAVPVISEKKVKTAMDFLLNMILLISEITIQKMEQEELNRTIKESEELFRAVFDSSNVGKSITQPTGEIFVNQAFCNMLGYKRAEFEHKRWQDITPKEEIPIVSMKLEPLLIGERDSARFEKGYICKDGTLKWGDVSVTLRRDSAGRPLHFITTVNDITERKQLEEERRLSEELFSTAFHSGPAGMAITRISDGKFIDVNNAFLKMFGFDRDEVIGFTSTDIKLWTLKERKKILLQQLETGGLLDFEIVANSKSGKPIHILFSSQAITVRGEFCHITTMVDITHRKQIEELNRENEEKFYTTFHNSPDAITITRASDGHFIDVNESFFRLSGYSAEEIKGKSSVELGIWVIAADRELYTSQLMEKKRIVGFETLFKTKYGEIRNFIISGEVIQLKGEHFIIGILHDYTDRKKAEQALRFSEERFRKIFESAPMGIAMISLLNNKFESANAALTEMLDFSVAELRNKTFSELVFHEDQLLEKQGLAVLLNGQLHKHSSEFRLNKKNGDIIWITRAISVISDSNDEPEYLLAVLKDITARKRAEELLMSSEEKYRSIYENSSVAILLTSPDGTILSANEFACKLFNQTEEEICRTGRQGLIDISDPRLAELLSDRDKYGHAKGELTFMRKGVKFPCEVSSVVFTDQDGNKRTSMVIRDLTEQKEAESRITALNQTLEQRVSDRTAQLENANKELETFTYSVSHDLKAPLRGIDGYSKLLLDQYSKELGGEVKLFLNTIRSSTLQMNQLIEDLLEYSRLERQHFRSELFNLKNLLDLIVERFKDELIISEVKLIVDIPDIEIMADDRGLEIVLRNLLENAIKFSKGVQNPLINIGMYEKHNALILFVKDNGIGFEMKYHQRIFEIFQRLHRAEEYHGTGIGLAMVAKAVHRMNGKVYAESEPGKGSTFFIEIPKLK